MSTDTYTMMVKGIPQKPLKIRLEGTSIKSHSFTATGKQIFFISFFLILLIAGYDMLPYAVVHDRGFTAPETPKLDAAYSTEQNAVTITVECGQFTRKSNRVAIRDETRSQDQSGKTPTTTVWASRSLFGFGVGNTGITEFPITAGETITIHNVTDGDEIVVSTQNGKKEPRRLVAKVTDGNAVSAHTLLNKSERTCSEVQNQTTSDNFWNKQYLISLFRKQIPA